MNKSRLFKVFNFTAFLFFISASVAFGQVTSTSASGRTDGKTQEVVQSEARVNQLTAEVGDHFKKGLFYLEDNRRPNAREEFDKTIEVFLLSNVNVQSNPKLRECYSQLTETIYRMEFPTGNQPANIRSLSSTCGWNIDNDLADKIAKIVQTAPIAPAAENAINTVAASTAPTIQPAAIQGFAEQKFEVSPLDDLAKLELTPEEKEVAENPIAQQQYQYIQVAVANKSLGFSFQVHPMIQQFVNYYQGRGRATMETGLYRSGMFMQMARRIFREEGVPVNVAWLGQVESSWKPAALSSAAASGLWQFIPGTGVRFGLRRTAQLDERNGFENATRASAKYLKFLANRYGGNWELAMAAYNSGEGNVDRAIRRAGVANFWVAFPYLPQETRNYVPNILATILIANNPNQYGFGHIRPAAPLMYDQIRVPPSTNLSLLAQASDTSVEYIRYLNPELRSNISPSEPYIIRVPAGKANEVVAVFRKLPAASRNSVAVTRTAAGETWQNISNRTGISVEQLQAANAGAVIPRGKIVIPNGNGVKQTSYTRPAIQTAAAPINGVRTVKAKTGDTVASLAQRYGASPIEVAKYNGLFVTSILASGREVKLP